MSFRVHPAANGDLMESLVWLVQRHRYEVVRKLNQLWLAGIDAIEANPQMYPIVEDPIEGRQVRNYLLPRYGYRIVYEVFDDGTLVLAFARGSRKPGHWHNRVSETE